VFETVNKKLERAEYFLNNLNYFVKEAKGLAYVPSSKQQAMRANLDGFFFELISAKDFFLQEINNNYELGLQKGDATIFAKLKARLGLKRYNKALAVVESIEKEVSEKNTWQWKINNYRNSATHRELLSFHHNVEIKQITDNKELINMAQEGKLKIKPIFQGQEANIPPGLPGINIPPENVKTFLYKDPEAPDQGCSIMEVLPYCEESLKRMRNWLENLYLHLGIT